MTPFTFIIKRKAYALAALVALTCAGLASCTDDNLVNNNGGGEKVNPADAKLATTTVTFSAGEVCSCLTSHAPWTPMRQPHAPYR